jgi:hypothetical protein
MSKDKIVNPAGETKEVARPEYARPEVYEVASVKRLIQGPMIQYYYDCIGSGMTTSRPNC